jgi:protocatechuate 3,4-dioxygenase beta subunit
MRRRAADGFRIRSGKHQPEWALCYRFNIVLRGSGATPMETK